MRPMLVLQFISLPTKFIWNRRINIPLVEAERTTDLVESDQLSELPSVHEEVVANVLQVAVDEGLLEIEAQGDDVLGVLHGKVQRILERYGVLEEGLLVVRKHEDQRDVEHILQPLGELQGNSVTQVQTAGTGTTTGVEEERLAALVEGQDAVEVTVTEEQAASEPAMRLVSGHLLEALEELVVNDGGVPFPISQRLVGAAAPMAVQAHTDRWPHS